MYTVLYVSFPLFLVSTMAWYFSIEIMFVGSFSIDDANTTDNATNEESDWLNAVLD